MKTTIDVPEEILVKAKVLAAERRTTLREIVVEGLTRVLETNPDAEIKKRQAALKRLLKGMRASNTEPMAPLKREEIHDR